MCEKDIECCECYASENLYHISSLDKILCKDCLIELAEERSYINSMKTYYTDEYTELCNENDTEPIIDYLVENYDLGIQEIKGE